MIPHALNLFIDVSPWLDVLTRCTLILLAAWAVHMGVVRTNPRWRVLLWRCTGIMLLIVPAWILFAPGMRLNIAAEAPGAEGSSSSPLFDVSATAVTTPVANAGTGATPLPSEMAPNTDWTSVTRAELAQSWRSAGVVLWMAGAMIFGLRWVVAHRHVRRLVLQARAVDPEVAGVLAELTRRMDLRSNVDLRSSDRVPGPLVTGFVHPTILLPARMTEHAFRAELPAVLAHELCHLRSQDLFWMALLQATTGVLLWFHPLAWAVRSRHASLCEEVCDTEAATLLGSPRGYARTLARVALQLAEPVPAIAGIPMARSADVNRRLAALQEGLSIARISRTGIALSLTAAAVISGLCGIRVVGAEQKRNASPTALPGPAVAGMPKNDSHDAPKIERRAIGKRVKDFPEKVDLSKPESAAAAWNRAAARMNAKAVLELGWRTSTPADAQALERSWKQHAAEMKQYNQAQLDAEIIEVLTYRGDLAGVVTRLEFPPGVGRDPYSLRTFGRINGQWKNLGEDRLPTQDAAIGNFEHKKGILWTGFEATRRKVLGQAASTSRPATAAVPVALNEIIERTINDLRTGEPSIMDLETGAVVLPDPERFTGDHPAGRRWLKEQGLDLVGLARTDSGDEGVVVGYDLKAIEIPSEQFATVDGKDAQLRIRSLKPTIGKMMKALTDKPTAYVFETREGACGVLQVQAIGTQKPARAFKIRYRLLSRPEPTASRPAARNTGER